MSGAEEYLDGLLHSVEGGSPADTARETEPGDTADGLYAEKEQETKKAGMSEEDDFLKSFEADTDLEGDADTFIRQFEDELDQAPREERTQKTTEENNQFFKDLDGILDSARDADESTGGAEAAETAHASEDGDLMVDTIGDFQDDDSDGSAAVGGRFPGYEPDGGSHCSGRRHRRRNAGRDGNAGDCG